MSDQPQPDQSECRREFEKEMSLRHYDICRAKEGRFHPYHNIGDYVDEETRKHWITWQACWNRRPQPDAGLIQELEKNMGEASARKDEGYIGATDAATSANVVRSSPASVPCSEISLNEDERAVSLEDACRGFHNDNLHIVFPWDDPKNKEDIKQGIRKSMRSALDAVGIKYVG